LKKKKKETYPPYHSAQRPNSRHPFPRSGPSPAVPFLCFFLPLTRRPLLSASPRPPSFFFLSSVSPARRRRRDSRCVPPLPLPFLPTRVGQLRQLTPCDQLGSLPPSLRPSRDGRGHQWQAPPPGILPPPLTFLSLLLFKLELELLPFPLHSNHTSTRT
jgi:hypothetical protein